MQKSKYKKQLKFVIPKADQKNISIFNPTFTGWYITIGINPHIQRSVLIGKICFPPPINPLLKSLPAGKFQTHPLTFRKRIGSVGVVTHPIWERRGIHKFPETTERAKCAKQREVVCFWMIYRYNTSIIAH